MLALSRFATLLITLIAAASFAIPSQAGVQSSNQQRCLGQVAKSGSRVAKAQIKDAAQCLKSAATGRLQLAPTESCMTLDLKAKVAKARSKTLSVAAASCSEEPEFGFPGAGAVNDAAENESVALMSALFGAKIEDGAVDAASDAIGATCQAKVLGAVEGVVAARIKTFLKCEKTGLKDGTILDIDDLSACIDDGTGFDNPSVTKKITKLENEFDSRCGGTILAVQFPGQCITALNAPAMKECLVATVDCSVCRMLTQLTGDEGLNCDLVDDGLPNASCTAGPISSTTSTSLPIDTTTTTQTTTTTGTTTTSVTTSTTMPTGAEGACTNPSDEAIIASVDIQPPTTSCTLPCLSNPSRPQCIADCLAPATGLSGECALCYAGSADCGIQFCLAECAVDQSAPACLTCLDLNCIPAFDVCTGDLTPTTTTTLDTTTTTTSTTTTTFDGTTTTTLGPTGSCTNPADDAVHQSFDLEAEAVPCTVACLGDPSRVQCIEDCLVLGTGISSPCGSCYADSAECGLLNCAGVCALDQQAVPCRTCLEEFCLPDFDVCSGLGDPPAPANCTSGTLDGDETDIDCGGSCGPCALGDTCAVPSDCISGECDSTVCVAPSTPIVFNSCVEGFIDPFTDPDGIDLAGGPSGSDDGYVFTLGATTDVFLELTNQLGSTTVLRAALVSVPGDETSIAAGLDTGLVVTGQNGTGGPANLTAGTYYAYVDSQVAETFGPYRLCIVDAPTVALDSCVTGNVGNGDGDDVQFAGAEGLGGDRAIRFTAPSSTEVIVSLHNLSGTAKMAAALFNGATQVASSSTGDSPTFTQRNSSPASVSSGTAYTLQVDSAELDTFGAFEVCVREVGCGDGLVLGGEQCDDSNQSSGDGCSSSCNLESGKIVVNSCRNGNIPLFPIGEDCDEYTLPILEDQDIFLEVTSVQGTLLGQGKIKQNGSVIAQTNNVPVFQTGSTAIKTVFSASNYSAEFCDDTGAGTGNYQICVRPARKIEIGTCLDSNVADGDGNLVHIAGPSSGGDEAVLVQPAADSIVKLSLSNNGGGGLLGAAVYDGTPGNQVSNSEVGASPSPVPVGATAESGLFELNGGQIYRVYTDVATLGTAGTDYTICLTEVAGDACLNDDDELVRSSFNLSEQSGTIGRACTGNASCISTDLQAATGLSAGCADCFGSVGGCAASNCALACLSDSNSSGCLSCVASNCAEEYEICSGWVYGQ